MTSQITPPDISGLSLGVKASSRGLREQYQQGAHEDQQHPSGLRQAYHHSTSPPVPALSQYNALGMNQSPLKARVARGGLPASWIDPQDLNRPLSPPADTSDFSSMGGTPPPMNGLYAPSMTPGPPSSNGLDDDIIPTAIVIKNIPFNVKKEALLEIITSLDIPTPYAFNYHLDGAGAFRGLAFANFRQPEDADAVVAGLNGFDVQGRKLRVEYKKVLQADQKERIEREKAIRRMRSMQMDKEQNGAGLAQTASPAIPPVPMLQTPAMQPQYDEFGSPMMHNPYAMDSRSYNGAGQYSAYSPPTVASQQSYYGIQAPPAPTPAPVADKGGLPAELDMNDPATLDIYSRVLLFKDDRMRDELAFSRNLSPKQRRIVHLVAQRLGVYHYSVGEGEERYAVVTRNDPNKPARTLSRAPSAYLRPSAAEVNSSALRVKKSMPDMKTLSSASQRLSSRMSNGNMREGYSTIASSSRRGPGGYGGLFSGQAAGADDVSAPPVPALPSSVHGYTAGGSGNGAYSNGQDGAGTGGAGLSSSVLRQPRGPSGAGNAGFGARRTERATASEATQGRAGGFEARSHEPLEI